MRSLPTALALTCLAGLLWPMIAAASIGAALATHQRSLGWALLALVIVATLIRPVPFADIGASLGAALFLVLAIVGDHLARGEGIGGIGIQGAIVSVLVLLATPWIIRIFIEEVQRVVAQIDVQTHRIDELTIREESGVYRPRFLESILDDEIGRARRYRRSLMLGLVAADDWNELVEDSSAPQLAALMREIDDHLLAAVRPVDKVVTLGNGEWLLVLPETPLEGAAVAAERIQKALGEVVNVPMRIGLADFPRDAVSREGLMDEARQALSFARVAGISVVDRSLLSEAH